MRIWPSWSWTACCCCCSCKNQNKWCTHYYRTAVWEICVLAAVFHPEWYRLKVAVILLHTIRNTYIMSIIEQLFYFNKFFKNSSVVFGTVCFVQLPSLIEGSHNTCMQNVGSRYWYVGACTNTYSHISWYLLSSNGPSSHASRLATKWSMLLAPIIIASKTVENLYS